MKKFLKRISVVLCATLCLSTVGAYAADHTRYLVEKNELLARMHVQVRKHWVGMEQEVLDSNVYDHSLTWHRQSVGIQRKDNKKYIPMLIKCLNGRELYCAGLGSGMLGKNIGGDASYVVRGIWGVYGEYRMRQTDIDKGYVINRAICAPFISWNTSKTTWKIWDPGNECFKRVVN